MAVVGCLYRCVLTWFTPGTWLFLGARLPVVIQGRCLHSRMSVGRKDFVNTNIVAPTICFISKTFFHFKNVLKCFTLSKILNNHSERWITRLANRWRAQQSAITIANCRIYWAAITWTQIAASGIPGATFAWGSTIITKSLTGIVYMSVDNWAFAFSAFVYKALCGLKYIIE